MKTLVSILAMTAVILIGSEVAPDTAQAQTPQYVGVDGCASCHKKDAKGNQLAQWQQSRHSKAYETLASPRADTLYAKARGTTDIVVGAAQKADQCLQCHVTAHGVADSLIVTPRANKEGHVVTNGVACESCHGPGSEYKKSSIMKDRDAAIAAGLVIPDKTTCVTCHNDKSPTFTGFNFEEMFAEIAHPNPEAVAE